MNNNFIIASSLLSCSTDFIQIINPYHDINKNPIITVYASGDFTNFEQTMSSLKDTTIKTAACAFPTGIPTPTTASGFILNYYKDNKSIVYNDPNYLKGTLTTINKDINKIDISGNCYYNVYATNILTISKNGKDEILGYGDLVSSVYYLTRSPYPYFGNDSGNLTLGIEDRGEKAGDITLVNFTFDADNILKNFANTENFGVGYPTISESGLVRISCSGIASGVYFPSIYNGSNEDTEPIYSYMEAIPSGLVFKVPKFITTNVYSDYNFNIEYINSSGNITGPVGVTYSAQNMQDFFTKQYTPNDGGVIIRKDESNYEIIDIEGVTNRSRIAVGVSDIDLVSTRYNQKGVYVSNIYTSEKPIYLISMETNEAIQTFSRFNSWDIVKYYIKIQDDPNWIRISPKPRVNELDEEGGYVPSILILDDITQDQSKISDIYNTIKFISYDKAKYNFSIKIEIDTNITGMGGKWTPSIYDYKISVVDRASILNSNYERYLFN